MSVELKEKLKVKSRVLKVSLNKNKIRIKVIAYVVNKQDIKIDNIRFYIDDEVYKECKLNQYKKENISKIEMTKNIYTFVFNINDIINDKSKINGSMRFTIYANNEYEEYKIGKKSLLNRNIRYYYLPIKSIYVKDFAIHIRRTKSARLVLVKRKMEPIEYTSKFKILESRIISKVLYFCGKFIRKISSTKVNLFYEKFSSKAEEGVYDLFLESKLKGKRAKNFYIICEDSEDYNKIKNEKNVVKKFSFKYYWLIYRSNNCIATEAPIHLNILRSNNKTLRKSLMEKQFIFLQHGIIYMKNLELNAPFSKNQEGEANYIVASSEKEKSVIEKMLNIDEKHILKTGIPIFSKIRYNHINNNSNDYITIMLTYKPYEEQMQNFEKSSYYKNVSCIYTMLQNYIDKDKIIIISHPRALELIKNTNLKDYVWNKPISKALEKTKLLITDYSSICYNAFYQGAGVVFYQPDLSLYEKENGKLIPSDDEYIGKRAFSAQELENIFNKGIQNKKVNLDIFRNAKYIDIYKTINEFSDGENIKRIFEKLIELKVVEVDSK